MLHNLLKTASENNSRNALFCNGKFYTYKELYDTAFGIENYLKKLGIERIGIYTDNNFYTYAAILGVVLANKTFVPLNHKFPQNRLNKIADALGLVHVLTCKKSFSEVEEIGLKPINIQDIEKEEKWKVGDINLNKNCYILFTSGSTGEPKGIPIKYKNVNALLENVFHALPMNKEDKVLQTFELSFDVSIACTFMTWFKGATLYLSPLDGIIAVNAFKTILDNKLNWVCIAPSAITYLKKLKLLKDFPLPCVETTIFTGEALPFAFTEDWKSCASNTKIYNAYGPTENTVWSFVHELKKGSTINNGLVPIGKPLKGFNYVIENIENGKGELMVHGDQVFEGYLNNEDKSNEVLMQVKGKTFYKTGDIVKEQELGEIMYLNRSDNQVQINGYRVELGEVEYKVKEFLKLENCIAFVNENNKQLVAVLEDKKELDKDLKKELLKRLPFYMQPKKFYFMDQFPLNSNSKIDRKSIKEKFNEN